MIWHVVLHALIGEHAILRDVTEHDMAEFMREDKELPGGVSGLLAENDNGPTADANRQAIFLM